MTDHVYQSIHAHLTAQFQAEYAGYTAGQHITNAWPDEENIGTALLLPIIALFISDEQEPRREGELGTDSTVYLVNIHILARAFAESLSLTRLVRRWLQAGVRLYNYSGTAPVAMGFMEAVRVEGKYLTPVLKPQNEFEQYRSIVTGRFLTY